MQVLLLARLRLLVSPPGFAILWHLVRHLHLLLPLLLQVAANVALVLLVPITSTMAVTSLTIGRNIPFALALWPGLAAVRGTASSVHAMFLTVTSVAAAFLQLMAAVSRRPSRTQAASEDGAVDVAEAAPDLMRFLRTPISTMVPVVPILSFIHLVVGLMALSHFLLMTLWVLLWSTTLLVCSIRSH